jgi:hypothetical protein
MECLQPGPLEALDGGHRFALKGRPTLCAPICAQRVEPERGERLSGRRSRKPPPGSERLTVRNQIQSANIADHRKGGLPVQDR